MTLYPHISSDEHHLTLPADRVPMRGDDLSPAKRGGEGLSMRERAHAIALRGKRP